MIGDYATLPYPKEHGDRAYMILSKKFKQIGALLSIQAEDGITFQVDYPDRIRELNNKEENSEEELKEIEEFNRNGDKIIRKYMKTYEKYL